MNKQLLKLIGGIVVAVAAFPVLAQIYKWKDANGVIQYSDTPPPSGSKTQLLDMKDVPVSAVGGAKAAAGGAPAAGKASGAASGPAQAQQQAPSEKNPKLCAEAQGRKRFLDSGSMAKVVNDKGEVEFMNDDRRKSDLAEIQKAIDKYCN